MKDPSRTRSRPNYIVCPRCGSGELRPRGSELAGCDSCGLSVEAALFRTLEQIATLPNALGAHACECGHPEMRRLPGGVFHCPACGSEVLPLKAHRRSLPANLLGSTRVFTAFPAGDVGKTAREWS
jgi:ribosomal protein L37AE/L43A